MEIGLLVILCAIAVPLSVDAAIAGETMKRASMPNRKLSKEGIQPQGRLAKLKLRGKPSLEDIALRERTVKEGIALNEKLRNIASGIMPKQAEKLQKEGVSPRGKLASEKLRNIASGIMSKQAEKLQKEGVSPRGKLAMKAIRQKMGNGAEIKRQAVEGRESSHCQQYYFEYPIKLCPSPKGDCVQILREIEDDYYALCYNSSEEYQDDQQYHYDCELTFWKRMIDYCEDCHDQDLDFCYHIWEYCHDKYDDYDDGDNDDSDNDGDDDDSDDDDGK